MRGALAEVRRCSYEAEFILFDGPKEFRQTISGARQCRPCRLFAPRKALWCVRRCMPLPRRGMTRRLRRGLGLAVLWGVHTVLSVAKEKGAKESQRHGDSGKKPFTAHF